MAETQRANVAYRRLAAEDNTSEIRTKPPMSSARKIGFGCSLLVMLGLAYAAITTRGNASKHGGDERRTATCIDSGDTAWLLCATTFVMLQTPACGMAQAGLIRRKNCLSIIGQSILGLTIGSTLWYIVGFSLTFGESGGGFIGSPWTYLFWRDVYYDDCFSGHSIPMTLFATFQMMFALMVPVIITGAWAEKFSFSAYLIFICVWPFLVYYPVAHWVWNADGFLAKYNTLDFAGGLTIHTTSGVAAFCVALMQERRKDFQKIEGNTAHNMPLFLLGGTLIWAGWYSFNGGSALAANEQGSNALANTQISSCTSCVVWCVIAWFLDGVVPTSAMISGALAGLAGVTPASGYVVTQAAFCIGIVTGIVSSLGGRVIKSRLQLDDVLDVASLQAIPGIVGSIIVGFVAETQAGSPGYDGLWMGHDEQGTLLEAQVISAVLIVAWTCVMTCGLMLLIRFTVGTNVDYITEHIGLDQKFHGEVAYDSMMAVQEWQRDEECHYKITQSLEAAAKGGNRGVNDLKQILASGHDIATPDYDGRTVFHVAAAEHNKEVLEYLFGMHGMEGNKDVKDKLGNTPLHDAMSKRHHMFDESEGQRNTDDRSLRRQQTVDYLTGLGCSVGQARGLFSLMLAIKDRKHVAVKVACDQMSGLASSVDYDHRTPLHVAVDANDPLSIAILMEHGAEPNVPDRWGKTALDYAENAELRNVLQGDAQQRAAISAQCKTTALSRADADGDEEVVEIQEMQGVKPTFTLHGDGGTLSLIHI
eukprot:TRINITY_DN23962_c0_g1_i2.p1 TRINITY_DN23962_c0_g1~~TRINITY_DN23962_c0_g1_i2.p1  ORF type:complete len:761 (+),score=203.38 TRINITY_DN23962_c0_g1_i2:200-2482(+)